MRSVFFVTLIPCALSHALCSACALVSAAVLGSLVLPGFGVDSLITRVIGVVPADSAVSLADFHGGCSDFSPTERDPAISDGVRGGLEIAALR